MELWKLAHKRITGCGMGMDRKTKEIKGLA